MTLVGASLNEFFKITANEYLLLGGDCKFKLLAQYVEDCVNGNFLCTTALDCALTVCLEFLLHCQNCAAKQTWCCAGIQILDAVLAGLAEGEVMPEAVEDAGRDAFLRRYHDGHLPAGLGVRTVR